MPNYCFNKDTGKVHKIKGTGKIAIVCLMWHNRVPLGNCPNAGSAIQKAKKKHPKASAGVGHCP